MKRKTSALFIFTKCINYFAQLRKSYPDTIAVWYDGSSRIIDGIVDFIEPERIFVEDGIGIENIKSQLVGSEEIEIVKQESGITTGGSILAVMPSNDTHVHLFKNIFPKVSDCQIINLTTRKEHARQELEKLRFPFIDRGIPSIVPQIYSSLLLGNDWGEAEMLVLSKFRNHGVPVYCLQESVINFNDWIHRMEWCDYPMIQGVASLKYLKRNVYFLTGNPRYETLTVETLSTTDKVMINSNFTYNIFEEIRDQWVSDVVDSCGETGIDYIISQHPRDTGNLSRFKVATSSAAKIHDMIKSCSTIVTRFSSVIHEGLALGRVVIYYNPHGESMFYDFEPDGIHLILAVTKEDLKNALMKTKVAERTDPRHDPFFVNYIMRHCGSSDHRASDRVAQSLTIERRESNRDRRAMSTVLKTKLFVRLVKKKLKSVL